MFVLYEVTTCRLDSVRDWNSTLSLFMEEIKTKIQMEAWFYLHDLGSSSIRLQLKGIRKIPLDNI